MASVIPLDQKKIKSKCKHPFEEDLFSWTFDLLDNNFWKLKDIVRGQKRPKYDQKSPKVRQKRSKVQKSPSGNGPLLLEFKSHCPWTKKTKIR